MGYPIPVYGNRVKLFLHHGVIAFGRRQDRHDVEKVEDRVAARIEGLLELRLWWATPRTVAAGGLAGLTGLVARGKPSSVG
jgi:hypothetical protein